MFKIKLIFHEILIRFIWCTTNLFFFLAMVVTTGVPYIDDCDAAFIDYDYINPPLPSTASDASGRSSCMFHPSLLG